jgi:glycosyltransferase involved in cell wall biosynthesis
MQISAILITKDEAKRVSRTLESITWMDEIIVVDSESSDQTRDICRSYGAKVLTRPFDTFDQQKNFALQQTQGEWVFSIDADEIISDALREEIKQTVSNTSADAFRILRHNYFFGKRLKFGKQGKDHLLRLFRRQCGKFVGPIHEVVQVNGKQETLQNPMFHFGTDSLASFKSKWPQYMQLEAKRMNDEDRIPSLLKAALFPLGRWCYEYLFLGGILDGRSGLLYHALSCYYGWAKNFKARKLRKATMLKTALSEGKS